MFFREDLWSIPNSQAHEDDCEKFSPGFSGPEVTTDHPGKNNYSPIHGQLSFMFSKF